MPRPSGCMRGDASASVRRPSFRMRLMVNSVLLLPFSLTVRSKGSEKGLWLPLAERRALGGGVTCVLSIPREPRMLRWAISALS